MNIQQERQLLKELLESGKLDSLSVQVIALNRFANSHHWEVVDSDIRKGFKIYDPYYKVWLFKSLRDMQEWHNTSYKILSDENKKDKHYKIVERVSIQYHKRTTKQLSSELHWLKFVKES